MTTYNGAAVSDAAIAFQKPITLQQGRALRNNPIAMAEGASGAPRIQGYALASDNNGLTVVIVAASDAVSTLIGSGRVVGTTNTTSVTNVLGGQFTINAYTGVIRFRCSNRSNNASGTSTLEFRKNGVVVSTFVTTGVTAVLRIVDIPISVGDVVEMWHKSNNVLYESIITAPSSTASDGYVERPVYWLQSQA